MAQARKLPSGRWNIQVYDKETGKRVSFTEDTKKKAEYAALEWQLEKNRKAKIGLTVGEAIDKYIDGRRGVISPSTIYGYEKIQKYYLDPYFAEIPLASLTQEMVQMEVKRLSNKVSPHTHKKYAPKTIHNYHGLISGALGEFMKDFELDTALPEVQKRFIELPPVEDVIAAIRGTDIELTSMLAMWLSLSISEIRGINVKNIKDGILTIRETVVQVGGEAVHKAATKEFDRARKLAVPDYIMGLIEKNPAYIAGEGYLETRSNQAVLFRFKRVLKKHGIEGMTFHQLRHMNASVMDMLKVPSKYAQERGGWKTDYVMKRVYQHTFSSERESVDVLVDGFFDSLVNKKRQNTAHEIAHDTQ